MLTSLVLVRHGQTEWSKLGKHTSFTDISLDTTGSYEAQSLGQSLSTLKPTKVFSSPLKRARQTCELAGFTSYEVLNELAEWNYGSYEGLTSKEIRSENPRWSLFEDGAPNGEGPEEVYKRSEKLIEFLSNLDGCVICFTHGHISRVIAACWISADVSLAKRLALESGHFSILGYEHDCRVISAWNLRCL